ncbi:MAG: PEP-CTERM sorting domain-containing protein [Pirellulales bacterium]|nr:PEP-CTERM sorting domain-containing protein [Pirellulales bacterium]
MMRYFACVGAMCLSCVSGFDVARGASSFSDPLTSFNAGLYTVSAIDPIVYDASGAAFGSALAGDDGRSYQRTIDADYATVSFRAEITFTTTADNQQAFFGLGTGDRALFGTPDWSTQFSSASFWPEINNGKITRFRTANDVNTFGDTTVPGIAHGTHRLRMTFNATTKQLLGEIDLNYAGGPFAADPVVSNFPIVTTSLFAADGWPSEPSSIFFGGDDGAVLRDFSVTVIPEPTSIGLLAAGAALASCRLRRRR